MISRDSYEILKGWIASAESYLNTCVDPASPPEMPLLIGQPTKELYEMLKAQGKELELIKGLLYTLQTQISIIGEELERERPGHWVETSADLSNQLGQGDIAPGQGRDVQSDAVNGHKETVRESE